MPEEVPDLLPDLLPEELPDMLPCALARSQFVSRNKYETTRAVMPRDDVDLGRVRHLPPTDSLSKVTKKCS